MPEFTIPIQFFASDEEKRKLEELCRAEHRSMSSMLRFLIHESHNRRFPQPGGNGQHERESAPAPSAG